MRRFRKYLSSTTLALAFLITACSSGPPKESFSSLLADAVQARTSGHEDRAANGLKEAFELLPERGNAERVSAVNQIYPEILALAAELRQLGRFSLSKTMYDKAIEIEPECTIEGKQSATALKDETEKVGDMELNLLKRADKAKELRQELKQLKHTTKDLAKQFNEGDYDLVAKDGRAHLEVLRKTRGATSNAYAGARRLVIDSLIFQDKIPQAIKLLEDDIPELSRFKDEDLKNADDEAVECTMFLSPLLAQIADLQLSLGRNDEAEKNAKRSLQLAKILGGKMGADAAFSQLILASIEKSKGKNKEALELARTALPSLSKSNKKRENWVRALLMIAQLESSLGKTQEAQRDFDKLIREARGRKQLGSAALSLAAAAAFYREQGQDSRFAELKDEAIAMVSRPAEPPNSVEQTYEILGDSAVRFSKFSEALGYFESALKASPKSQRERLEKKISMCKKNKSVAS